MNDNTDFDSDNDFDDNDFDYEPKIIPWATRDALGLDLKISHHNIFGGIREYILAVLDGLINYLKEKNAENVDSEMIVTIARTMHALSCNDYEYKDKNGTSAPESFFEKGSYEYFSYNSAIAIIVKSFNFDDRSINQVAKFFHDKRYDCFDEISISEKNCIVAFCHNCIMKNCGIDDHPFKSFKIDFVTSELFTHQESKFNIVAYRNLVEALYQLLKSKFLFLRKGSLGFGSKLFYSQSGVVLGFEKDFQPSKTYNVEFQEHNGMNFAPAGWKVNVYDPNLRDLRNSRALSDETLMALELITDNVAEYYDYKVDKFKQPYPQDIIVKTGKIELFEKKPITIDNVSKIFSTFDAEYINFVNEAFSMKYRTFEDAYKSIVIKSCITPKHKAVLTKYAEIRNSFNSSQNAEYTVVKLRSIMFDMKLLVLTNELIKNFKITTYLNNYSRMSITGSKVILNKLKKMDPTYVCVEKLLIDPRMLQKIKNYYLYHQDT